MSEYEITEALLIANTGPPIGRRFITAIISVVLLIVGCLIGGNLIDKGRKLKGYAVLGFSFFIFGGSIILFYLTEFRWSWGWWL